MDTKILGQDRERTVYLRKEWVTEAGLKAKVIQCIWSDKVKELAPSLHDHYCGYVEVKGDLEELMQRDLEVHGGITAHPMMRFEKIEPDVLFIGFDMAHYGDENIHDPEAYAIRECEKLAAQLL